ncbi:MAG: trimethylamine methyltransferase family protein [Nocardioides sp.]
MRGGGGLCSAIPLDAQAGAETTMSLWATYLAGCDLVVHAAGWLEGGLVASYEKLMLDLELIRMFERLREGLAVDAESLAFDAIAELGPGGLFLAHEHTLARFRTDVFMSPLFRSQAHPTWAKLGSPELPQLAAGEWRRLLESYDDPGIDPELDAALREYVDRRTRECEA